ncbi:Rrf2 family transcriptional regulator [Aestuariibacter sp. A3R04]|uniref:Rrf2 family transcriptional regulator n=1 Tax=Aestuariibacter sp. A3R04 TaxID=2841571 RepID=UPI001C09E12A|nr:Rrf2 family transcriptional regulator [Aestuariibacter sp. A3R04]
MRKDSRLSRILHVLLYLDVAERPVTSEQLGRMLKTNPVVVRRFMSLLREAKIVTSVKGHHGGWTLCRVLTDITLLDIHKLLGETSLFTLGLTDSHDGCLVEKAVNRTVGGVLKEAERLVLKRFSEISINALAIQFKAGLPDEFHSMMYRDLSNDAG